MTPNQPITLRLLCWLILMFLGKCNAEAQTAQEIAQKAFQSTVLLVMEDANGQPLSLGSGFFVRDGEIASNLHVVEGSGRGYAKIVGQKTKYDIEGVSAVDEDRDLVLLKVAGLGIKPLGVSKTPDVEVGEPVYAVGNPQGLEGTFSQGIVSSVREVGTNKLLQITAPISPGSSGGPILDAKGEVIGVSVATFKAGQNLNFAIPAKYLTSLLSKPSQVQPLKAKAVRKPEKSILEDLGGRSTDGVVGGHFAWTYGSSLGAFTFSLQNRLREDVKNVYCLIVFRDAQDSPIDVIVVHLRELIPAGLAKRLGNDVDGSVQKLVEQSKGSVEYRILDFEIVK